jgi:hypothetical protein
MNKVFVNLLFTADTAVNSRFSLLVQNVGLIVIYSRPLYLMAFLVLYIDN